MGWNLQFGEVRRSFRFGIPAYSDAADRFELDGQLLVVNPTDSTATRTRYHTMEESFVRILHIVENGQDLWEATRPDGTILRFGLDSASKVLRNGATGAVLRWLLREIENPDGNVVQFDYLIENGADYPQKVRYSYRGSPRAAVGTVRTVEFRYETRPDPSFSFMAGVSRQITRRVTDILITVGSSTFRKIDLVYSGESGAGKTYGTGRSRLAQVKLFGVGGTTSLPPQRFEYADPKDAIASGSTWQAASFTLPSGVELIGPTGQDRGVRFADVDGDGRVDMLRAYQDSTGAVSQAVYLNTGNGWTQSASWSSALPLDTNYLSTAGRKLRYRMQASRNGFILAAGSASTPVRSNPVVFASAQLPRYTRPIPGDSLTVEYEPAPTWALVDVNGDRRADLISGYDVPVPGTGCSGSPTPTATVREVWINTGTGWQRDAALSATLPSLRTVLIFCTEVVSPEANVRAFDDARVADLNADDRPDFIATNTGKAFVGDAMGWTASPGQNLQLSLTSAIVDVNRDGLSDVLQDWGALAPVPKEVVLNTGTGWCSSTQSSTCGTFAARYKLPDFFSADPSSIQMVDLNGDGFVDVLKMDRTVSPPTLKLWIQDPRGPGGSVWVSNTASAPPKVAALIDVDSDSDPDLVDLSGGQSYTATARFSDLLVRFENGWGGTTGYAYESAVKQRDAALVAQADGVVTFGDGVILWNTVPVLAARSFTGVDASPFSQSFRYAQPRFLPDLRLTRGFALVESSGGLLGTGYTYFAQQHGIAGRVVRQERADSSAVGERTVFSYEVLPGNDPRVGAGSTAAAYVGRLVQKVSRQLYSPFAAGEKSGASLTESFDYAKQGADPFSGYGFVTRTTATRSTGTTVTLRRLAAPDTVRWIVRLPEQILVTDGTNELSKAALQYNAAGHPTSITAYDGPRGNLTTAVARTTLRSYDSFGNVRRETDPASHVTEFCYDGDTTFLGGTSCSSPTTQTTHAIAVSVLDPLGQVTTQNPDTVTGQITEVHRRYTGNPGDRDRQTFDVFGRVKQTKFVPASSSTETVLADFNYFDIATSPTGQSYVEVLARVQSGSTTAVRIATYLDGFGREARTVSEAPLSGTAKRYFGTASQLDPESGVLTRTLPAACATGGADSHCTNLLGGSQPRVREVRDDGGRPLSISTPDGMSLFDYRSITRAHPNAGTTTFDAVLAMDPSGFLVQRVFDGDRLVWVDDCTNPALPAGTSSLTGVTCQSPTTTFYRYEALGQLAETYDALATSLTDVNQATTRSVFDSLGRIVQTRDINKTAADVLVYDAAGNLQRKTNARGQSVTFGYDAIDRVQDVTYPSALGTRAYAFVYDSRSRGVQSVTQTQTAPTVSTLSVQQLAYDAFGREIRQSVKIGTRPALVSERDFDLLSRTTRIRTPDSGTVLSYEYAGAYLARLCELGTATSCTGSGAQAYLSSVQYDTIGRKIGLSGPVPAGQTAPRLGIDYDPTTYRLQHLGLVPTAGTGAERIDLSYTYDPSGNIRTIADGSVNSGASDVPYAVSYTYDSRGRLLSRTRGSDVKHFTYNAVGNLTGKMVSSAGLTNQTYSASARHQLTSAGGVSYAYDADGNVRGKASQQFIYDALQRLECVGTAATPCSEPFLYGFDGTRLASDGGSTPPRVFVGDEFEWEPATGAGTLRIFALGQQIAYKRLPTFTLRSDGEGIGGPLEPWVPSLLGLVLLAALARLFAMLLRAGLIDGLRAHPGYGALTVSLSLLFTVPPGLVQAATLPTNQGVYRRWVWEDPFGSGLQVTDDKGVSIHQRAFEPFGDLFRENATEVTERTFATHRFEDTSGLYFMKGRWYDATVGRFQSIDPVVRSTAVPQSINAYSYVENNPVNAADPSGFVRERSVSVCSTTTPGCGIDPLPKAPTGLSELDLIRLQQQLDAAELAIIQAGNGIRELTRAIYYADSFGAKAAGLGTGIAVGVGLGVAAAAFPVTAAVAGTGLLVYDAFNGFQGLIGLGNSLLNVATGGGNFGDFFAVGTIAGSVAVAATGGLAAEIAEGEASTLPTVGTKVFRVFGEKNNPFGESFTPIDPRTVPNFRAEAGLPNANTGRFVLEGRLIDTAGVTTRKALPLDGNPGGLEEILIPNARAQVLVERVSGVNPEF